MNRQLVFLFTALWLFVTAASWAQPQRTPADAAYKHMYHLRAENYDPAKAAQTLYGAPAEEAGRMAEQLKRILDAYGINVDTNKISNNPAFVDSVSGKHIHYPYETHKEIYLQKVGNQWYYSPQTVSKIPDMYRKVFPAGSETISHLLKKMGGTGSFWELEHWQWLGIGFILLSALACYFLINFPAVKLALALTRKRVIQTDENTKTVRSLARMFSLLLVVRLVRLLYPMLLLPVEFNSLILLATGITELIFLGYLLYRLADVVSLAASKIAAGTAGTMDDQIVPLARKLAKAVILISIFLLILGQTGVNLTALLAGLSIGGLALAFAAQDTVRNVFGSLMLLVDRTFQVGDHVLIPSIDNIEGTVEEVGLRSTRIRTFDNSLIMVPNGKLADAAINNLGLRNMHRYRFHIGVTYDTPPQIIEQFVFGIREVMECQPLINQDTVMVHFYAFGASSLDIRCSCYFDTNDFREELNARHNLMVDIVRLASLTGIRFAYPTTTVHVEDFPGHTPISRSEAADPSELKNRIIRFTDQVRKERNAPKLENSENMD
jgi:MscS family membrane protein